MMVIPNTLPLPEKQSVKHFLSWIGLLMSGVGSHREQNKILSTSKEELVKKPGGLLVKNISRNYKLV